MNIAVLASGTGTNFEAIAQAVTCGEIKADLKLLLTDKENAGVRQKARKSGVPDIFVDPKKYASRLKFDRKMVEILKKEKIGLVVLAGYMRVLTPCFVASFKNKIINIHPALLPAFKGTRSIQRAFDYGCKITGVTVHLVDEKVDHGPIILQAAVEIKERMSLEQLEAQIHKVEHKLYPLAIKLFLEKCLKKEGRRVKMLPPPGRG